MNKTLGFAVIAIFVLTSFAFSQAFLNKASGNGMGGKGIELKLDLTKDQKGKIFEKENAMEKDVLQLKRSIRSLKYELNTELSAENPDKTKVNSLIDNISKNMTDIQKKEISFMLWMREQLTPEQKQKLLSLLKTWPHPDEEK